MSAAMNIDNGIIPYIERMVDLPALLTKKSYFLFGTLQCNNSKLYQYFQ